MRLASTDALALVTVLGLGVPFAVVWAIALVDVVQRSDREFPSQREGSNDRLFWTFVILLLGGIGALVYYLTVMKGHPRQRHWDRPLE